MVNLEKVKGPGIRPLVANCAPKFFMLLLLCFNMFVFTLQCAAEILDQHNQESKLHF